MIYKKKGNNHKPFESPKDERFEEPKPQTRNTITEG